MSPGEYLQSLAVAGDVSRVYALDGATLYKLNDDHYVVLSCVDHPEHVGRELVRKVMPQGWICFATGEQDGFLAEHYGPDE